MPTDGIFGWSVSRIWRLPSSVFPSSPPNIRACGLSFGIIGPARYWRRRTAISLLDWNLPGSNPGQRQFAIPFAGFDRHTEVDFNLLCSGNFQRFSEKPNDHKPDDPVLRSETYVLDRRAVRSFHLRDDLHAFEIRRMHRRDSPDNKFRRPEPDKYLIDSFQLPLDHRFGALDQFLFISARRFLDVHLQETRK